MIHISHVGLKMALFSFPLQLDVICRLPSDIYFSSIFVVRSQVIS